MADESVTITKKQKGGGFESARGELDKRAPLPPTPSISLISPARNTFFYKSLFCCSLSSVYIYTSIPIRGQASHAAGKSAIDFPYYVFTMKWRGAPLAPTEPLN